MPDQELTVYSSASPPAVLVLAHGAGGGQSSPFMVRFARGMAARGLTTATFDFPYMAARRKVPDRAPVLEAAWRSAIDAARAQFGDLPLFIGGKSMGGRIASHVASQEGAAHAGRPQDRTTERSPGGIHGLVFLGYPLHPPGKPDQRRDAHLPAIVQPMLFVQGTRDPFGSADEIRELVPRLLRATLHEVIAGDHSLKVAGRPGIKQDDVMGEVMDVVRGWIGGRRS